MSTPGGYFKALTLAQTQEIREKRLQNNARKNKGKELLRQKKTDVFS